MSELKTVRIVGGGLAGLSLGIALGRAGVPTEIFEAGNYPRHRVCGEFVTGLPDATIEKLGIRSAFSDAGSHRSVTWFRRDRVVGRQSLPAPARAISRFALDARLAALFVAGGGRLVADSRRSPPADCHGWVDASGRRPRRASEWVGLKLHVRNVATRDDLELHLGDGAYVGLSSVEDGWLNVCGLFRRRPGLRAERERLLEAYLRASGLPALAGRLGAAEIRPGSRCAVAGFVFARRIIGGEGVRLGDAGGMIPPFTGNGMAMAFTGSALALDPLVAWARDEQQWEATTHSIGAALRREFRVRLAGAALLHPVLLNGSLQRGLAAAAGARMLPFASLYHLLH